MRVDFNGTTYWVTWRHFRRPAGYDPKCPSARGGSTDCEIFQEVGGDGRDRLVAQGWAVCSHEDGFCKEAGRQRSLARALGSVRPRSPEEDTSSIPLTQEPEDWWPAERITADKVLRRAFWEAYFMRGGVFRTEAGTRGRRRVKELFRQAKESRGDAG